MTQIALAKQVNSSTVYVYNDKGSVIFTKGGTLVGFTSNTVSIKVTNGTTVYVYNERGSVLFVR